MAAVNNFSSAAPATIRSGMSVQDLKMLTAQREYRIMLDYWNQQCTSFQSYVSPKNKHQRNGSFSGSEKSLSEINSPVGSPISQSNGFDKMYITNSGQKVFFVEGVVNAPESTILSMDLLSESA